MASRKVVLLTKGYFRGLLDFKYRFGYSPLREAVVIDQLERESIAEILSQRLAVDNAIFCGNPVTENVRKIVDTLEKFIEMKLPYTKESSKMNSVTGPLSEEEKEYYRRIFADRKKVQENDSNSTT